MRERILLELNPKDVRDMRWKEVWDSALRIRNATFRKNAKYRTSVSFLKLFFSINISAIPYLFTLYTPSLKRDLPLAWYLKSLTVEAHFNHKHLYL